MGDEFSFMFTLIQSSSLLISIQVINDHDATPVGCAVSVVNENLSVYLQFQGVISAEAELEKIRKKMDEVKK